MANRGFRQGRSRLIRPDAIEAELPQRFPLLRPEPPLPPYDPRLVVFGLSETGEPVTMPEKPRFEHSHVIGTTGGGKTNFLEHLIRQDIKKGDGVVVIDPHGDHPDSLYRSLITWLDAAGHLRNRTVHLIDPNFGAYTTGFNPLALPSPETDVSVVAGVTLEAFERVWGDEDTHGKPTIRRLLKAAFAALAELGLTLAEADLLFDHTDARGLRAFALSKLRDRYARAVLNDLDVLAKSDRNGLRFRDEVVGPLNRLAEFLSSPAIRRVVGQREHALDLRKCLDERHIVLVNLSGGRAVNDADTELLGRLLTRLLFFHVKLRRSSTLCWLYLDECQRYLSGDIPAVLAEARKFTLGVVLSHQWQSQLGEADSQTLAAVHNATNLKAAFRIKHPKEAREVAEAVLPIALEQPVRALIKPTVIGQRRTWFANRSFAQHESETETIGESYEASSSYSESESWSTTQGASVTETDTDSSSTSLSRSDSESRSTSIGDSYSRSSGTSEANGWSKASSESNSIGTGIALSHTFVPFDEATHVEEGEPTIVHISADGESSFQRGAASAGVRRTSDGRAIAPILDPDGEMNLQHSSLSQSASVTRGNTHSEGTSGSRSTSTSESHGRSMGSSQSSGSTLGITRSTGCSNALSKGLSLAHTVGGSRAVTHGESHGRSYSVGQTRGTTATRGRTEGLEPIYKDLPSAVHSFENSLYVAATMLRSLPTGHAYMNFVDAEGMKAARVQVPRVRQVVVTDGVFAMLRERILVASAFCAPSKAAEDAITKRDDDLFRLCETIRDTAGQLLEPDSFRVPTAPGRRRR